MTASRGIIPPAIPAAHQPLPTVYLAEMTTIRGRQWWASLPDACARCAEIGKRNRLFLDAPVDIRDSGRVYCQVCSYEAATVEMRRPLYQRSRVYDRVTQPKKSPAKTPDMCADDDCTLPRVANRTLCPKHRTERYRERVVESGRTCAKDGCDDLVYPFGAVMRFCKAHNSQHRRANAWGGKART